MNPVKSIRERLGVTQRELAEAVGRSQGNVAFYERGQTVPPDVAKRLIQFAATRQMVVTFDEIYGALPNPDQVALINHAVSARKTALVNEITGQGA